MDSKVAETLRSSALPSYLKTGFLLWIDKIKMKRPVLLIIANVAILMAVFGSLARSFVAAPAGVSTPNDTESATHLPYAEPDAALHGQLPANAQPTLSVEAQPSNEAGTVFVLGKTEPGNSVSVDGAPVVVEADGSFSTMLRNCNARCTVKARNRFGETSQQINLSAYKTAANAVVYATR